MHAIDFNKHVKTIIITFCRKRKVACQLIFFLLLYLVLLSNISLPMCYCSLEAYALYQCFRNNESMHITIPPKSKYMSKCAGKHIYENQNPGVLSRGIFSTAFPQQQQQQSLYVPNKSK